MGMKEAVENGVEALKSLIANAESDAAAADAANQKKQAAQDRIQAHIAALQAEEITLLRAPAPKAELKENIRRVVDSAGKAWRAAHEVELIAKLSGRVARDYGPESAEVKEPAVSDAVAGYWTFGTLAAVLPKLLTDGLVNLVDGAAFDPGPALASRLARLKEIAIEIADAEEALTRLGDPPARVQAERVQAQQREARARNDKAMDDLTYRPFRPVEPK